HRGDAKLALAAPWLRDHHATHRLWPIRPLPQAVADGRPRDAQHCGRLVNVQTVHARSAFVGSHLLPRLQKVLSPQGHLKQPCACVVPGPWRELGFIKSGTPAGFTRLLLRSPGLSRHLTHDLAHPWRNFTFSRSALRSRLCAPYYGLC
ncbi:MAG: hypothetical protein AAAB20_07015, partial [Rhizobium sp.]|uniref:hypothetical protein n=1 Tax=Rhizobium sp. TaxID=391 RepID=UPI0030F34524